MFQLAWQTTLLQVFWFAAAAAAQRLTPGFMIGNPKGIVEADSAETTAVTATVIVSGYMSSVLSPLVEEGVFRVVPYRLLGHDRERDPRGARFWCTGALPALIFGLAHNLAWGVSPFVCFPLPQIGMGLFWWQVYAKYGFRGVYLSHAGCNAAMYTLVFLASA